MGSNKEAFNPQVLEDFQQRI